MLMRCYMTSVRFNERGNEVTMEKIRSRDEDEETKRTTTHDDR